MCFSILGSNGPTLGGIQTAQPTNTAPVSSPPQPPTSNIDDTYMNLLPSAIAINRQPSIAPPLPPRSRTAGAVNGGGVELNTLAFTLPNILKEFPTLNDMK